MNKITSIEEFRKEFSRLSRKFRSLPDELDTLITSLESNPKQGKPLTKT